MSPEGFGMKLVTAYINNLRVHWAVEELEGAGISEILVTKPSF